MADEEKGIKIGEGVKVMVSGGFDPLHVGHIQLLEDAAQIGEVIVALNSDAWLLRKKGYVFYPWQERRRMIMGLRAVSSVISFDDSDDTACSAIEWKMPDFFINGGDRTSENTPEIELCESLDIGLGWGAGGEKVNSSQKAVAIAAKYLYDNGMLDDPIEPVDEFEMEEPEWSKAPTHPPKDRG